MASIPPYIQLCMDTWRNLGDIELHLLDYSNVQHFTGAVFNENLRSYPLAQQADAIRFAILARHAGFWMDADTIVVRRPTAVLSALERSDVAMFGEAGDHASFGFIGVSRTRTRLLKKVATECAALTRSPIPPTASWDYIGKPFRSRVKGSQFEGTSLAILPEAELGYLQEARHHSGADKRTRYREYWLRQPAEFSPELLAGCDGIIALHNSWMDDEFRLRSKEDVLAGPELICQYLRHSLT
jgi:hypothetical protein